MIVKPSDYRKKIHRSCELMKPWLEDSKKYMRGYKGDYSEGGQKRQNINRDEAYVNFIYSYVETVGPSIFAGDPRFFAEAKQAKWEASAKQIAATVNYWFRELGVRKHLGRIKNDSFYGQAGMLTEWEYDEVESEVPNVLFMNPMTGKPVFGPSRREILVTKDQPLIERIIPSNIILDPDSESPEKDLWRARRIIMRKSAFDMIPGIAERVKKQVKAKAIPRQYTRPPFQDNREQGTDPEWVVLYKIYDLENEKCLMLCEDEDVKDYLYVKDWEYDFEVENDRFPITILEAKPDPENCYTFSEFQAFWVQIQERNRLRTMLQSHTRRQHPAWLAKNGANDEEQLEKFANAKIAEVVRMNAPDAIMVKPMPEFPVDSYKFDQQVADDTKNVSGFFEYNNDSIADTATEASLLASRGNIRKGERKEAFGYFIGIIGGKTAQLCQQLMDKEIAVKIRDPQNPSAFLWQNVTKEEIQGEYMWSAKPGLMQFKDEGLRRQQDLKFAETMGNNPHTDQRKMASILAETFDREPDEVLLPEAKMQEDAAKMTPEKPPLAFDKIKIELLAPEVQSMIIQAALKQNGVDLTGVTGLPPPMQPDPNAPPPEQEGAMPGAEMNQAPAPLPGADQPPMNPVMPASEMQGGSAPMGGL